MKSFAVAAIVALLFELRLVFSEFYSKDGLVLDEVGRARFFHGENFVQKGEPWYPEVLLDETHIAEMQSWGWNTVRLGVMWTGVEPQPGEFNETYIGVISGIIDTLEAHGIHALIDVHQDVISSYFCLYDGAPKWLIDLSSSCREGHEFDWPLQGECGDRQWGANYLAEATGAAFQDIYDNVNGMKDHFGAFWSKVAQSFKGKDLLGYEIINEPWAGNIYAQPSLLLPGVAGAENLQGLYDDISARIRKEDTTHMIFYEPVTWGMIFNGTVSGSGFTHVPGGAEYADKSVFSFHYYCWWYSSDDNVFERRTCDERFGQRVFDQVVEDVRVLGGAAMLTEWGQGCQFSGDPDQEPIVGECDPIMDEADKHLTSWIDWYWTGPLMSGWQTTDAAITTYSRTYAHAVAGTPTKMLFESSTKRFELCYDINLNIATATVSDMDPTAAATVIYVNNALHYPNGVRVYATGSARSMVDIQVGQPDTNRVFVYNIVEESTTAAAAAADSTATGNQGGALDVCIHIEHSTAQLQRLSTAAVH